MSYSWLRIILGSTAQRDSFQLACSVCLLHSGSIPQVTNHHPAATRALLLTCSCEESSGAQDYSQLLSPPSAAACPGEKHPGSAHHFHFRPAREVQQRASKAPSHLKGMHQRKKMLPHVPRGPGLTGTSNPATFSQKLRKQREQVKEDRGAGLRAERQMGELWRQGLVTAAKQVAWANREMIRAERCQCASKEKGTEGSEE